MAQASEAVDELTQGMQKIKVEPDNELQMKEGQSGSELRLLK